MLKNLLSDSESVHQTGGGSSSLVSSVREPGEKTWSGEEGETECAIEPVPQPLLLKRCIAVGDPMPYGERLYYESSDKMVRLMDIGMKHRIMVLGVIGSFTPYCWNRHLYQVMSKSRYYEERGIDYILCIATNDAYTHSAWSSYLGCESTIFMLSDATKRFTKALGMDIVVPWLDNTIRSMRYVIYAENMVVTKMIVARYDGPDVKWHCEHLQSQEIVEEDEDSELDVWL